MVLFNERDMGVCFSKHDLGSGFSEHEKEKGRVFYWEEGGGEKEKRGDAGAITSTNGAPRVMLRGSCGYASMFTQQGRKGVNQDTMTVWEVM